MNEEEILQLLDYYQREFAPQGQPRALVPTRRLQVGRAGQRRMQADIQAQEAPIGPPAPLQTPPLAPPGPPQDSLLSEDRGGWSLGMGPGPAPPPFQPSMATRAPQPEGFDLTVDQIDDLVKGLSAPERSRRLRVGPEGLAFVDPRGVVAEPSYDRDILPPEALEAMDALQAPQADPQMEIPPEADEALGDLGFGPEGPLKARRPGMMRETPEFDETMAPGAPVEPFERAAFAEDLENRNRRVRRLESGRGIAQGLGRVGQAFEDAALIQANLGRAKPSEQLTEGIDRSIAIEYDRMPLGVLRELKEAGIDLPPGSTYKDLESMSPALAQAYRSQDRATELQMRRENLDSLKETREASREDRLYRREERRGAAVARVGDEFDREPRVRKLREQKDAALVAVDTMDVNAMGQWAASIKAARASGEVGALTEADKEPFRQRQAWVDQIWDLAQRRAAGDMSQGLADQLRGLMQAYARSADKTLYEYALSRARRHAPRFGVSPEDIMEDVMQMSPQTGTSSGGSGPRRVFIPGEGEFEATPQQIEAMRAAKVQFEER